MPQAEADRALAAGERCTFNRSPETHPVLWVTEQSGAAAMKLNGVLVALEGAGETETGGMEFAAPGTSVTVRPLGDDADGRADAELVFELDQGLTIGYRGFYGCGR
jgi:hypothetical protein